MQLAGSGYISNERTSFLFHESYNAFTYHITRVSAPRHCATQKGMSRGEEIDNRNLLHPLYARHGV